MIAVESLSFSYKKGQPILQDLSFHVNAGSIFGFLGANGSGKTTTIRLMLGLCRPDNGRVLIHGIPMHQPSSSVFKSIGAMIEQPSLYEHLTGAENLEINALYHSVKPNRVAETLAFVGLAHAATKRASLYSLGMKQRLALAISLLHDPQVLILDEPLNGLDPKGIAEIRELLLRLATGEGKTILLSSHLLGEVETTCDAICIIDNGKSLFHGSIDQLRRMVVNQSSWFISCSRPEEALALLRSTSVEAVLAPSKEGISLPQMDRERIPELINWMVKNNFLIYEVKSVENNLESLFLELTH